MNRLCGARAAAPGILVLAFLLTACQANTPAADGQLRSGPAQSSAVSETDPVPRAAPAPGVARSEQLPDPQPNAEEILQRRLATLGLNSIDDTTDLVGRSADQIQALLGTPDIARREEPAAFWQYGGKTCVLNLFLYDRQDGGQAVDHVELRSRDPSRLEPAETCLKDILIGRITATG